MTRTARRRPTASAPTQVLTVADLLRRHGPVTPPAVPDAPRPSSTRLPARLALGACALLATGSVVGAAATTPAPAAGPPGAAASIPERGPLPPARPAVPLLGAAAVTDALDPGEAPAAPWTRVAFPDAADDDDPAPADDDPVPADDDRVPEADGRTDLDDAPAAEDDEDGAGGSGSDDDHPGNSAGKGRGARSDDARHDRGHGPRGSDDDPTADVLAEVADLL